MNTRAAQFASICILAGVLAMAPFCQAQAPAPDNFNPNVMGSYDPFHLGYDSALVSSIAWQPDGRILLGGNFATVGGVSTPNLARVNRDGSLDWTFGATANSIVSCLAVLTNGTILVGGNFTTVGGQPCNYLGRLNPDGTLDHGFNAAVNASVSALAVQPDGKIVIGGSFTQVNGLARTNLARLNADGSFDATFSPPNLFVDYSLPGIGFSALALQPDGKILVGGTTTRYAISAGTNLFRLNPSGSLDTNFSVVVSTGLSFGINCLAVDADDDILVGGQFGMLDGQACTNLARLNADGSLQANFSPAPDVTPASLTIQADGSILIGGRFGQLAGQPRNWLGRILHDGTLDGSFDPQLSFFPPNGFLYLIPYVGCLAIQPDGAALVGGVFSRIGPQLRSNIGRLTPTGTPVDQLTYDGTLLLWQRGGPIPEVLRATFDVSTNGTDWVPLGDAIRVPGGWAFDVSSAPAQTSFRARGFITGSGNSSSWFVENILGPPAVDLAPVSRTNNAGTTAYFEVTGGGTPPLTYQWLKNGQPLGALGNAFGATTPFLTLSNVAHADSANYALVISNAFGSITSKVATLTIIDPFITTQPQSTSVLSGQSASFHVLGAGTAPLTYQWYENGARLIPATNASFTLTKALPGDAGDLFSVVVTDPYGSVTSLVATLTVNLSIVDPFFNPGPDQTVLCLALETNGSISMGGYFFNLAGHPARGIGRVYPNGVLDFSFTPAISGIIESLAVQADDSILAGGSLSGSLARMDSTGNLDPQFVSACPIDIVSMAVQADGKVVTGGYNGSTGSPATNIARMNLDGSVDAAFGHAVDQQINALAVQTNGSILVGGFFNLLGGQPCNYFGRLNPDGTLDTNFNPSANGTIESIALQPDGKILVGGSFTMVGAQPRLNFARLNPDGSADPAFNPGASASVDAIALQADGKILAGGTFTSLGGSPRQSLARLNADGSLDPTFDCGTDTNGGVFVLTVQPDGALLVGGGFATISGQFRTNLARIKNDELAIQSLAVSPSAITWLRGGASPEVWRTEFDASTNGVDWTVLGGGQRIPGGWRLSGLPLPNQAIIRALGWVAGDEHGSSWIVQSFAYSPPNLAITHSGNSNLLLITGLPDLNYEIDFTPDLRSNWQFLTTLNLSISPQPYLDLTATNASRFYRAVLVP
jgi:uncharacterized delta-60 repeat protein